MKQSPVKNIVLEHTGSGCMVEMATHKKTGWLITLNADLVMIYWDREAFFDCDGDGSDDPNKIINK